LDLKVHSKPAIRALTKVKTITGSSLIVVGADAVGKVTSELADVDFDSKPPYYKLNHLSLVLHKRNMAESLSLPLRPSIVANPMKDSLQVRIGQINKQKGAFRHVTEASLLKEIDGRGNSDVDVESDGDEDALKPEDRQALVWKGKEAMLRQIE
jgi:hypothetical protein